MLKTSLTYSEHCLFKTVSCGELPAQGSCTLCHVHFISCFFLVLSAPTLRAVFALVTFTYLDDSVTLRKLLSGYKAAVPGWDLNLGQVLHTYAPLLTSSTIWY